jgi:hypothetical protein
MQSKQTTVEAYMKELPEDRYEVMEQLRKVIKKNLPKGFKEEMSYGMIGYVVPHSIYPAGYHCDPKLPLPFLSIAAQKNFIALYHMGIYGSMELLKWFEKEYPKHAKTKLDMGKSCIRMKKMDDIPYQLIGELCTKMSPKEWIAIYEKVLNKK